MSARSLCSVLALAALAGPLSAQVPSRIGIGLGYERFNFDSPDAVAIENISLLTVPLAARYRVNPNVSFELAGAYASGKLVRVDGSEATLSGLNDTELRAVFGLGRDAVTLTAIALLPTGKESLSEDEADLAGVIAADVLPFRISNWGTGGGFGMSAAVARPMGDFAGGLSVGYVVAREFEPLADDFTYRPGNQLEVRAALDRTFGDAGKAAVVFSMLRYQDDEIDGSNLFRTGNRYQVVGSYAFAAGARSAGIVYGGYLRRQQGEFLDDGRIWPAQDLIFGGLGFELRAGGVLVRPSGDLRVLRRDDGVDQGYTADLGGSLEFPAGGMTVIPSLRGRFGNVLLLEDIESSFTGFELGFALRFGRDR